MGMGMGMGVGMGMGTGTGMRGLPGVLYGPHRVDHNVYTPWGLCPMGSTPLRSMPHGVHALEVHAAWGLSSFRIALAPCAVPVRLLARRTPANGMVRL